MSPSSRIAFAQVDEQDDVEPTLLGSLADRDLREASPCNPFHWIQERLFEDSLILYFLINGKVVPDKFRAPLFGNIITTK